MSKWLFLVVCVGCVSFAQAKDKVTFEYKFKTGQTIRSHIVVDTDMSMGKSNLTMDSSMHVDSANPDGSANLTTKIDGGDMKMMGMKMKVPGRGKEYHMTVSKYGKRMEMGDSKDKATVVVQEFPDHPIGVGESWDGNVQIQGGRTPMEVTAHFTLDSIKNVSGHKIAHVLMVEDADLQDQKMKIHATGWMDWDVDQGIPTASHVEGTQDMSKMSTTFVTDSTTTIDS